MTIPANQILQQALQLPLADREQMADQLYLSLQVSAEVKTAWGEEIASRIAQVDNKEVTLVLSDQVHQQIQELIDRERPAS